MPRRATKRGAERTPLARDCDVLVCGASFAGLAVARELAGSGARVLIVDRYEIGERQTSACGIPTRWLYAMGLERSLQQTFGELVIHTPRRTSRRPPAVDVLDLRLPHAVRAAVRAGRRRVRDREGRRPHGATSSTPTAATCARRSSSTRSAGAAYARRGRDRPAPGGAASPAASRSTRRRRRRDGAVARPQLRPRGLRLELPRRRGDAGRRRLVRPRDHVKEPTVRLAADLDRDPVRFQGNWIPHRIRPAVEDGVSFVGDSAGHCLPLTAEGIRTALYFGLAAGRELRTVRRGPRDARRGTRPLRRLLGPPPRGSSRPCSAPSRPSPVCTRAGCR